ncbi:MAG: AhpC/TSA family protein [Marinifilaceae bacterium]|jgi:thiol-disulfide isomerase/thioredoxin|nr:AhpC/TSA family protein [Marinifilaceae bacterium]
MKKILYSVFAACLILAACQNKNQYKINGTIEGLEEGKAFLSIIKDNSWVKIDSADIKNNSFSFTQIGTEANIYKLSLNKKELRFLNVNSPITITGNIDKFDMIKVSGSECNDLNKKINEDKSSLIAKQKSLGNNYRIAAEQKDQKKMDSIYTEYKNIETQMKLVTKEAIKANSDKNYIGLIAYMEFGHSGLPEAEEVYNYLSENAKGSKFAKLLNERVIALKKVEIGQIAPDFTLKTKDNKDFSLSSLKGKVVVIDFWASWCGPCRRENPNMLRIYSEYKDKGVEFLGVSLDDNKEKWLAAIIKDELPWTHVSDLKGWNSAAAKLYCVSSIPCTYVLNKEGKIVGKKIFGEELEAELTKLTK